MANLFGPESKLFGKQSKAEGGGQGAGDNYHGLRPGDIPPWSERFEYDAGREVLAPDGNYYRCLVDHTASEDFNADIANWELFGGSGLDTNDQLLTKVGDNIVLSGGSTGGVPIPDSTIDMNDFAYLWDICGLPITDILLTDTLVFCRWNGSSYDKYNVLASAFFAVENLEVTLNEGNFTGAHDIIMSTEVSGNRKIWTNNATSNNRFFIDFEDGGAGSDGIAILRLGAGIVNSGGYAFFQEGLASIGYTQPGEGPDSHFITLDDVGYKRFKFESNGGTSYIDIDSSVQLRFEQDGFFGTLDPTSLTGNQFWTLPDQTGTFALLSDIVASSLQDVLAVGYVTGPNPIHISGGQNLSFLDNFSTVKGYFKQANVISDATAFRNTDGLIIGKFADDGVNEFGVKLLPNGGVYLTPSGGDVPLLRFGNDTWAGRIDIVPATQTAVHTATLQDASGTIAFLSDISTYETGQTYTETNVTTDRAYDANSTSLDELADVVGTLLSDLRSVNIIL